MPEPTYIPRHKGEASEDSFENLRRLGIGYVQDLAGDIWTDYNVHDPGVTILEQLCYALTDSMYRADFDVKDLLAGPDGSIDWKRQGLALPESAFPCRPATAEDYRAVILDAAPALDNVQVEPLPRDTATPGGLYRLRLLPNQDSPAAVADAAEQARLAFSGGRNLCEDLESIEVAPSAGYTLKAEVQIRDGADPAEILAKIYFACGRQLAAGLTFSSFDRALKTHPNPEEVFRGPYTASGMVVEDRGDPRTEFPMSDLFSILKSIDGVESVKPLGSEIEAGAAPDAVLLLRMPQTDDEIGVKVFRGGREVRVWLADLRMRYEEINFANRGPRFAPSDIPTLLPPPEGVARDLQEYLSVQYHFPPVYGVGPLGPTASAEARVKARARQLRSYLLLFDQHMADYAAMLANLRNLFSTDLDKRQTYFLQTLDEDSFPGIADAYNRFAAGALKQSLTAYRYGNRTRRLLDYLLALYGETFNDDRLKHAAPGDRTEEEDAILDAKIEYLKRVADLTRNRGGATDYTREPGDLNNRSGLEATLSHLLGFERDYQATGDGVRVFERILLRPMSAAQAGVDTSQFSFRIAVLFPAWPVHCQDPEFRKLAADTVDARCPAHIYADIHWLDRPQMDRFDGLHEEWWKCYRKAQKLRVAEETGRNGVARAAEAAMKDADATARELLAFLVSVEEAEQDRGA